MSFALQSSRGLTRHLVDNGLADAELDLHITEIPSGQRAHPPHTHEAVEAYYILTGTATVEVGDEIHQLGANEAITFDARQLHGILNTGARPLRYLVIATKR